MYTSAWVQIEPENNHENFKKGFEGEKLEGHVNVLYIARRKQKTCDSKKWDKTTFITTETEFC